MVTHFPLAAPKNCHYTFHIFPAHSHYRLSVRMEKEYRPACDNAKGSSTELSLWLPVDQLAIMAARYLHDSVSSELSVELDRIDIRPQKGTAKFVFKDHYWGLQLDCTTGKLLLIERRKSDFIEDLHDGSILDDLFKTSDEQIKLGYTTILGISLLMLTITGFWLWYGPKRLRKTKKGSVTNRKASASGIERN